MGVDNNQYYKDYGFTDNELIPSHEYILPVLVKMLKTERKTILDLGCGDGKIASFLLRNGFDVYGVDASETGISIANNKHPGKFFLQDFSYQKLPKQLEDVRFDIIISTEVIEHLYAPREFISLCKSILRRGRGGELILSTPYHGYLKNIILTLTGQLDKHLTVLWDGGHIKFWSRKKLTMILEEQIFRVVDFMGAGRVPFLWESMFIKAVVGR